MHKSWVIWAAMAGVLLSLTGCFSVQQTQIQTQAQGEVALKADQYAIELSFTEQAPSSEGAMTKLQAALADFKTWKAASGFDVVTLDQSVRPLYTYPKEGLRQLSAYEAQHRFKLKALTLQQYADTMTRLSQFKPQTLNQGEVGVSEAVRQQALQQAYADAYRGNQEKLKTLMGLAELCSPTVLDMKEYTNSHGAPRAMMMEAKSAPVANEHVISVRLEISWQASAC